MDTPLCRSCGAPIWWGRTASGGLMPINPHTSELGTVVVDEDELALRKVADVAFAGDLPVSPRKDPLPIRVLRKSEQVDADPDVPRYICHFATCPPGW